MVRERRGVRPRKGFSYVPIFRKITPSTNRGKTRVEQNNNSPRVERNFATIITTVFQLWRRDDVQFTIIGADEIRKSVRSMKRARYYSVVRAALVEKASIIKNTP